MTPQLNYLSITSDQAHTRRKFFEAKAKGEDPQWVLGQIQQLYQIETQLREARSGPAETHRTRQAQSFRIMECIKTKLDHLQASRKHLLRSLTGEAITYALNQWDKLCVSPSDGRVQINNLVKNAIRSSSIGKKNWLFMGDAQTGDHAATFYTLIANSHREGIDATAYFTDIFTRLPTETNQTVHRLTPKAWAAEQKAKHQTMAQAVVPPMYVEPVSRARPGSCACRNAVT